MRRRHLLCSVCLPILATAPLRAETLVEAKRTDPVRTSTIKSGAADDIRITSAGSIVPTDGIAVRIDSFNKFTNEGTIQITNADGAIGVLAYDGLSGGGIVNTGKIILDETYEATDADKDGDLDGPLAAGTGRSGIRTAGAYTGAITNSGTITVEGKDSAGIWLGGPLSGNFTHDGTTAVIGDRSVGVRLSAVSGNVRLAGTITAQGEGAVAARIDSDVAGALVVQGNLSATGYRTVTVPADTSKLDADDLLQGGSALVVGADVLGGVILAVPPKDSSTTDNDEDKDGIDDSKEGSAAVTSYGAAPAVQIGAASRSVAIGAVAGSGTGFGLIIDGSVSGQGLYAGVEANGLSIGGLGGAVTIANGIGVNGKVEAISNGASATAIRIGSAAATPEIRVAGSVSASGGSTATSKASAIVIEAGGNVATIRNSGTIRATAGGADGSASAIVDRAGTVTLVENSGAISASGALATSDRNVAIDLSANTSGVVVRQTVVAAGVAAPSIAGDVRFGAGDDVFDIADGSVRGNARFGAGNDRMGLSGDATFDGAVTFSGGNDRLTLAGTSVLTGAVDFGGGEDSLALSDTARFTGSLLNARGLAVAVNGGTLDVGRGASIASLAVGNGGVLSVLLDNSNGGPASTQLSNIIEVSGAASFAQGSKLAIRLASISNAEGRYTVLRAGNLTGASNVAASTALLPFLFKGTITTVGTTDLAVDIIRKTSTELSLNRSQAAIYDAAYRALGGDQKVGASFLAITDGDTFRRSLRQMLPDHAGGAFELVSLGSRTSARMLADPRGPFKDEGRWGYWINQIALGTSKSIDDTAGYSVDGWGISSGGEYKTGIGNFGLSIGYLSGRDDDRGTENDVHAHQWELAGYWRGTWGGLHALARASAGRSDFSGRRRFSGNTGTESVTREARGSWNGTLVSATGGASYEMTAGMLTLRPQAMVDYYRFKEDGYSETGGGKAFDLIVNSRTSDELAVSGTVAAGLQFGGEDQDSGWLRFELEGGRRQLVGGSLGNTIAHFEGGEDFTLTPQDRTSGWLGRVRATGGNSTFRVGGEFGAEQQQGRAALSLRVNLQFDM